VSFDYSEVKAAVSEALAEFGRPVAVVSPVVTTNPSGGTVTKHKPIKNTVNIITVGITKENAPEALIKAGDMLAIADGEIKPKDTLLIDKIEVRNGRIVVLVKAEQWQVVSVNPIQPGDTGLVWKAQVRR